jgi:Uri superfamily endonuclease
VVTQISRTARGVYLLWLWLPTPQVIEVGALGSYHFTAGYYAYVGSAQNGLRSRIKRHCRLTEPLHWHIDYLRVYTELVAVAVALSGPELECKLAAALRQQPDAELPVSGFGASDCKCISHLYFFRDKPVVVDQPQQLWPELMSVALDELL